MKRIVLKIGSSSLIKADRSLDKEKLYTLVGEIAKLERAGISVCLVTSGAVALGIEKIGLSVKPKDMAKKQACAAVGQMALMQEYEQAFEVYGMQCAQILVSHDDFGNRERIGHMTSTVQSLYEYGVVPVVNENDALAVEEIKLGDNDTLSSMMALVTCADLLVIISDIDGLFTSNPKTDNSAKLIPIVNKIDGNIIKIAGGAGSDVGTGGMATKINAAIIATNAGIDMMIINQTRLSALFENVQSKTGGTLFTSGENRLSVKKAWILYCADVKGRLTVDDGAKKALLSRTSLLPVGVTAVFGNFYEGEVVEISDKDGGVFAKGIINYSSDAVKTEMKKRLCELNLKSAKNKQVVIHADNLALTV